jgi:hypothetical protein
MKILMRRGGVFILKTNPTRTLYFAADTAERRGRLTRLIPNAPNLIGGHVVVQEGYPPGAN